ncbi:S-adenosylmethionine-dependent methyltransferase [Aspergillus affinis]|uniref:S-adenosylmethionine-dependent methyltransferase n=1 Tax=Aspergillus affinis TaxID=1070780 RepID=UPI0022FE239B|nr:uncharacterized protein KD926_009024 [Aspergillus affinis]KAI9039806.1 hypothetical protein KD926_009024 [Aspergillus affinis]
MLPTPCTSHVSFDTIYEPSEDSYLFLDTLSSTSESTWLKERFNAPTSSSDPSISPSTSSPSPLIIEVGSGSGVVLGFVAGNSYEILGRRDILTLGIDVNRNACLATKETVQKATQERQTDPIPNPTSDSDSGSGSGSKTKTIYTSSITSDLLSSIRPSSIDIILFNPPYVPTEDLPRIPTANEQDRATEEKLSRSELFDRESYFLSLTYAGGKDGMETTDRLIEQIPDVLEPVRGVAYVLLCKQNRPGEVRERIRAWGGRWRAEFVGNSGVQAGWEKLVILRIWRE